MAQDKRRDEWNRFVIENDAFFLQSWEWGNLQVKLSRQIYRLINSSFAALFSSYNLPFGKRYIYAPKGPVLGGASDFKNLIGFISELKKNIAKQVIFLRIEPALEDTEKNADYLKKSGFIRTISAQPETTLTLDLKKSSDSILKEMEYETRYAIRTAQKRGVIISKSLEPGHKKRMFEKFWPIFDETNRRHNLKSYPKNYYLEVLNLNSDCNAQIFCAELGGKVISSAIIVYFGKRAVYLYSASASSYGKFNAPTLLLWEAIKEAKERGYETFDFWGISHENPKWGGITAFKKSFGGKEMRYTGTWDYIFNKRWYWLYSLIKKLTR